MELLNTTDSRGYPPDYLKARIKGRRACLIDDWEPLLAASDPLEAMPASPHRNLIIARSPEEGWKNLLRESAWLYSQMDKRLRHVFSPLFGWLELRTLTLCLRNMLDSRAGRIEELLQQSLLSAGLQKVLLGGGEHAAVINAAAALLAADSTQKRRLTGVYRQEGVAGFERELTDLFLAEAVAGRLHPLISEFLAILIDARNIITLYKQQRWRISTPPAFIAGGSCDLPMLCKLAKKAGREEIMLLIRKVTRTKIAFAVPESVERLMLTWVTRTVRRWGRNPSGPGMILDYIWRCYLEARNLGLLVHCRGADRELLRMELIQ